MAKIYIGTFTDGESKGIYYGTFEKGKITIKGNHYVENPSYLTRKENNLYAVSETLDGEVVSFHIQKNGSLIQTAHKKVFGDSPCYVSAGDNHLYTANYSSGSISEFIIEEDGRIDHPPKIIVHYGHSSNTKRQSEPHVHQTLLTPDRKMLAVCDLGIDAVCFYPTGARGIQEEPKRFKTPQGMGPRHLAFGKEDNWYVITELSAEVLFIKGYEKKGEMIQRVSLAEDSRIESYAGAIALSPDGDSLLCTLRGEDTLILFSIDKEGKLGNKKVYPAHGKWPRDGVFSPDGKYVLAALQHTGKICVFEREKEKLHLVQEINVPGAACICF